MIELVKSCLRKWCLMSNVLSFRGDQDPPSWGAPVQFMVVECYQLPLTERSTFHQLYRLNSSRNLQQNDRNIILNDNSL